MLAQTPTTAHRLRGLTLIELLIVVAIGGLVASLALPAYTGYVERTRLRQAVTDLRNLEIRIERFRTQNGRYPDDLAELGIEAPADPWGEPYAYLEIASSVEGGKVKGAVHGKVRKDRKLNPINLDFDLYSIGVDARSKPPLTAPQSHDDVVRAGSGSFIGLAIEY